MAGRSRTLSENRWLTELPHVLRCVGHYKSTGEQCRRVAMDGSVVCDQHGGAAPQTLRRAAERVQMTADDAASQLVNWMNDDSVEMRERVKIAQDLMDRAGLAAARLHKIMPVAEDPVEALFRSILEDPNGLIEPAAATALPAAPVEDLIGNWRPLGSAGVARSLVGDLASAADEPERLSTRPPKHIREALDLT